MSDCEGVHVGLFDPTRSAAAPGSLAPPLLGAPMRTRRVNACRGGVSTTTLVFKDGAASHALQDEDDGPVVAGLCADCGAAYANRAGTVGCSVCRERLAIGLVAEYDPGLGGYCGGCAVDTATNSVRAELNDACALAVTRATASAGWRPSSSRPSPSGSAASPPASGRWPWRNFGICAGGLIFRTPAMSWHGPA